MPNVLGYFQVCSTYCCEDRWPVCPCADPPPAYWTVDVDNICSSTPAWPCGGQTPHGCGNLIGTFVLEQTGDPPPFVLEFSTEWKACTWWCPLPNPGCGYTWAIFINTTTICLFQFVNDDGTRSMRWIRPYAPDAGCCDSTPFVIRFSGSDGCTMGNPARMCETVDESLQVVTVTSGGCS